MKKFVFLAAALLAAGTLTAAEALKINGNFKILDKKTNLPSLWLKNGNVKTAVFEVVKDGENNIYKFVSQGKHTAIYTACSFPAADGDQFEFVLTAKGKAEEICMGVYTYDSANKYIAISSKKFAIDSPDKFTEYKEVVTVKPKGDMKTAKIRVFIGGFSKGFDVQIKEIRVTPAAK